jgi:hypothetical protein
MDYVEFKTNRRTIYYNEYTLRDFGKTEEFVDFRKGSDNYANIAIELQLPYKDDEERRGGGG